MALLQKYGILYPFQSENNDCYFLDLNESRAKMVQSKVLHVLFTPKGQKLRDPEFGTDLIKFLFEPSTDETLEELKLSLQRDIKKQVPEVDFTNISIHDDENDEHSKIIIIDYDTKTITGVEHNSVGVKI